MMADEENEDLLVALMRCGDVRAFERLLVRLHSPAQLHNPVGRRVADRGRRATRIAFVQLKRERRLLEATRSPGEAAQTRTRPGTGHLVLGCLRKRVVGTLP